MRVWNQFWFIELLGRFTDLANLLEMLLEFDAIQNIHKIFCQNGSELFFLEIIYISLDTRKYTGNLHWN